jgi:hypothetical protein
MTKREPNRKAINQLIRVHITFFGGKHSLNVKNVIRSCEKKHFTEAGQQKHICKKYVRENIESAFFSGLNSVQWGLHYSELLLSIRNSGHTYF